MPASTTRGGGADDRLESTPGDELIDAGGGDDHLLAFGHAGEPAIAQTTAVAKVEPGEPVSDTDRLVGGSGADLFAFRWLIDAKPELLAEHTDATGDIDYRAVANENDGVHDHWVESIGEKIVLDFDPSEGDRFLFEGHTLALDRAASGHVDADGDSRRDDTLLAFYSNQNGAGAHDGDRLGSVAFRDARLDLDTVDAAVDAGVFYGIEDPYSLVG